MKETVVLIPSRLRSTRLPNKMVKDVNGIPLIVMTAKNAEKSGFPVVVLADSKEIIEVCEKHRLNAVMTPESCESGTDRMAFMVNQKQWKDKIIVNVQGDEPVLEHQIIKDLSDFLIAKKTDMATVAVPLKNQEEWDNPNCVKVITNAKNDVMYFSRARVPFDRDGSYQDKLPANVHRHLGIYGYTSESLMKWLSFEQSNLEKIEKLEQWRAIENGLSMSLLTIKQTQSIAIDTQEDLNHLLNFLNSQK